MEVLGTGEEILEMAERRDKEVAFNVDFGISKIEINKLIGKYEQRKNEEDLKYIEELGGDQGIAEKLKSSFEWGISEDKAELGRRVSSFGSNKPLNEEMKSFWEFVKEELRDIMLRILIIAAVVEIILGATFSDEPQKDWIEGFSIFLGVFVVIMVGSITNYQKEKKFQQLNFQNSELIKYSVFRGGEVKEIKTEELVVGDIVTFGEGINLPADGILISGSMVKVDESPLTGESDLISKCTYSECIKKRNNLLNKDSILKATIIKSSLPSPIMLSGTMVKEGNGKYMLLAVGAESLKGKINETVKQSEDSEESQTPLEEKLSLMASQVGYFGLIASTATLIVLAIQLGISYSEEIEEFTYHNQTGVFIQNLFNNLGVLTNTTDLVDIRFASLNSTLTQSLNQIDPRTGIVKRIIDIIVICIAILVVAIPDGLPLAVTLSLSLSIKKMLKENNLVRKLRACETMGGANYICSDKTGTLTENVMSVVSIYDGVNVHTIAHDKGEKDLSNQTNNINSATTSLNIFANKEYAHLFTISILLNIDANIDHEDNITRANKTDQGLINFFKKDNKLYSIRNKYLGNAYMNNNESNLPYKVLPFNSDRKRMSTLVKNSEFPTGHRIFIKGASDYLLEKSTTHYLDPYTSETKILTEEKNIRFREVVKNFGDKTLRTLLICYKDITQEEYENYLELDENGEYRIENDGLTVVAIVGLMDKIRKSVPDSVAKFKRAGIKVIMVTGDMMNTAEAIAKKCGIIENEAEERGNMSNHTLSITGAEFYSRIGGLVCETCEKKVENCECPKTRSQAKKRGVKNVRKDRIGNLVEFAKITENLKVLARSRPIDKYALVVGLRLLGQVVAVTGDGTNDAPALSKSDVGFAMGIQGTDIAKDASDIIIMDDNFSSIVTSLLWGRNVYDNIRRFIQFQLTDNMGAGVLVFVVACLGNESPIKAIHMLWIKILMDSFGSIALATEPPQMKLLDRPPHSRSEMLISPRMWKHIGVQALFQLGIMLFIYLYGPVFIIEDDYRRIAESMIIQNCYEVYPGRLPVYNPEDNTFTHYIINGSISSWKRDVNLKPGMTSLQCGDYALKHNLFLAYETFISAHGYTSHLTILFNILVFYNIFIQLNSRIIDDSFNILRDIHKNPTFIFLFFLQIALQVLFIQFGGSAFKICEGGLTLYQWGLSIGFGAITFLVSVVVKLIPLEKLIEKILDSCKSKKKRKWKMVYKTSEIEAETEEMDLEAERDENINDIMSEKKCKRVHSRLSRHSHSHYRRRNLFDSIVLDRSRAELSIHSSQHHLRENKLDL